MDRTSLGNAAEEVVAAFLATSGVTVLERNLRVGRLEIDLLALDGRSVVVVEVRTRGDSSFTTGFGSIDSAKRARLRRAGQSLWRTRFKADPRVDHLRFDAASVTFGAAGPSVEYVRAAF